MVWATSIEAPSLTPEIGQDPDVEQSGFLYPRVPLTLPLCLFVPGSLPSQLQAIGQEQLENILSPFVQQVGEKTYFPATEEKFLPTI